MRSQTWRGGAGDGRRVSWAAWLTGLLVLAGWGAAAEAGVPKFRMQEIDRSLKIGYAVLVADINGDGKPDIVVCDKERVIWFENPTWKLRTIVGPGKTGADNVCIAAADLDGDGKLEIALGGNWMKMAEPAALYWLKRGATPDEEWSVHEIAYPDPTLHRMRFADVDGDGRPELVVAPLHGLGATAARNFAEAGPRFGYFKVPADLSAREWEFHLIDDSKRVMHNFLPADFFDKKTTGLLTASYEGVYHYTRMGDGKWLGARLGEGNQADPTKARGASEVKVGTVRLAGDGGGAGSRGGPGAGATTGGPAAGGAGGQFRFIATVEPFHGREVVTYFPPVGADGLLRRQVIDDQLKSGHALACADLDGDGVDEIVMGFRDPFSGTIRFGINVYRLTNPAEVAGAGGRGAGGAAKEGAAAPKWERTVLESGGMATEDLAVADLNGDGRPDVVAVGRATKNVRVYWNEGK